MCLRAKIGPDIWPGAVSGVPHQDKIKCLSYVIHASSIIQYYLGYRRRLLHSAPHRRLLFVVVAKEIKFTGPEFAFNFLNKNT